MTYSLAEAAKATGKNRSTILRAVKSGKISASKIDDGSYMIDPAELHRIYEPVRTDAVQHQTHQHATPDSEAKSANYWRMLHEASEREKAVLQGRIEDLSRTIDDLRKRLDASETERRTTQARLENLQDKPPQPERSGFFDRIFGRR